MEKINKKIILVGSYGVGKTSLVKRFVSNTFSDKYITTIGVKIEKKEIYFEDKTVKLLVWDIAGEMQPWEVSNAYFRGAHGALIVCDLSRPSTFLSIKKFKDNLIETLGDIPVLLLANKIDLLNSVEIQKKLSAIIIKPEFTTSAKTGDNVEEAFRLIAEKTINIDQP